MIVTTERRAGVSTLAMKAVLGVTGLDGPANVLDIGTVTTLLPWEEATATIEGTSPEQTINLGIPRGYTGASTVEARYYVTRAAIAGATIDVNIKTILTGGYDVEDHVGSGRYARMAVAPSDTTNPAYVRSLDRFTSTGATHATNGGWWQLVPHLGMVTIEQFGGKPDFNNVPASATDHLPLVDYAIAYKARVLTAEADFPYRICFGLGRYWFSGTLEIHSYVHLWGMCIDESLGSELCFPSTSTCIVIGQSNTVGESGSGTLQGDGGGTIIEGLAIRHHYSVGAFSHLVYSPAHGIHSRAMFTLRNTHVLRIAGHGILIHGSSGAGGAEEGAPNAWKIRDCQAHSCGGHGLAVYGADSNAGSAVGFSTHTEVGGCGIYDASYFVNTYTGIHIAGYGNRGVTHGGRAYVLIGGAGTTAPNTTTPGDDNEVWYDIGADSSVNPAAFDPWDVAGIYDMYRLPIWDSGGGRVYTGVYVEISVSPVHVPPPSIIHGGTIGSTIYSYGHASMSSDGSLRNKGGAGGGVTFTPGTPEYIANGDSTYAVVGGRHETQGFGANGGIQFLQTRRLSDVDATWQWGFAGNAIEFKTPNGTLIWSIGTRFATRTFGRTLGVPYKLSLYEPIMEDITNSNNGRVLGNRSVQPTDAGEYGRGDRWFNINATPGGFEGWVVTTAGALHNTTWSSGVGVDGNTWLKNSANRIYRYISGGSGTSTSEPVHTSGTVTAGDGNVWTWVSDTSPVFKEFGSIAA